MFNMKPGEYVPDFSGGLALRIPNGAVFAFIEFEDEGPRGWSESRHIRNSGYVYDPEFTLAQVDAEAQYYVRTTRRDDDTAWRPLIVQIGHCWNKR